MSEDLNFSIHHHPAENKVHEETVVFVHHMWGNARTTWRHYRYLNELGYDCVTFDLIAGSSDRKLHYHPLLKYFYKGIFYIWTKQIRMVLDQVEGEKIVFAFSGPSLSALWACDGRTDIKKVICDGGPFHHVYKNTRNFFRQELGVKQKQLNAMGSWFGSLVWGYKPLKKLHKVLSAWNDVPILSIRGLADPIVAIESIRQVFEPHAKELKLSVLEIPEGLHLNGMRDHFPEYSQALTTFLK